MNIPELPIQLLAVTEHSLPAASSAGAAYASPAAELEQLMVAEGSNLADRLNAHFMTSTSAIQQKCKSLKPILTLIPTFSHSFLLHALLQRGLREED